MRSACNRVLSRASRRLRWIGLGAAIVGSLWACNARRLAAPDPAPSSVERQRFLQSLNRKLDLVFMIDNSGSMEPLQEKLAKNLPVLVQRLTTLPGGLPDIHIAVVSSSSLAGMAADVPGCQPTDVDDGRFRHQLNPTGMLNHPECANVKLNGNFIKAEAGVAPNFTGRIEDVFSCIALLGQTGCGFEQQLGSIVRALDPGNPIPENAGFLRADAYLGVVMLTNEDDCSTDLQTHLFDDQESSSAGPLGRFVSYRCAEFGILCGGQKPPHTLQANQTVQETACVSAEGQGQLIKVSDFDAFLLGLKHGDRSKILLASISAPPTPFSVSTTLSRSSKPSAGDPTAPGLVPSCVNANGSDYGDPGVRIAQVVSDFGGVQFSICDDDYGPAMDKIGVALGKLIGPQCLVGAIANDDQGHPDCTATDRSVAVDGTRKEAVVPFCDTTTAPFPSPCWLLRDSPADCGTGHQFVVCRDPTCSTAAQTGATSSTSDVTVECAIAP